MTTYEQAIKIAQALSDKLAQDIKVIEINDVTVLADYMVIATGRSSTQVKALADEVKDMFPAMELDLRRTEGYNEGRWIVMDFASILVHIFCPDERQYYNMERLWSDPV